MTTSPSSASGSANPEMMLLVVVHSEMDVDKLGLMWSLHCLHPDSLGVVRKIPLPTKVNRVVPCAALPLQEIFTPDITNHFRHVVYGEYKEVQPGEGCRVVSVDPFSGKEVWRSAKKHNGYIFGLCCAPVVSGSSFSHPRIVSGDYGGTAQLWDLSTGKHISSLQENPYCTGFAHTESWNGGEAFLCGAYGAKPVPIYDLNTGKLKGTFPDVPECPKQAVTAREKRLMFAGVPTRGKGVSVRVYARDSLKEIEKIEVGDTTSFGMCCAEDLSLLFVPGPAMDMMVYDLRKLGGESVSTISMEISAAHTSRINESRFVSIDRSGSVVTWETKGVCARLSKSLPASGCVGVAVVGESSGVERMRAEEDERLGFAVARGEALGLVKRVCLVGGRRLSVFRSTYF